MQKKVKDSYDKVDLYDCWASSRLDRLRRFSEDTEGAAESSHDFAGYPCKTFLQKSAHKGPWVSGAIDGKNEKKNIYFRGDFMEIVRLAKLEVGWIGEPSEWEL